VRTYGKQNEPVRAAISFQKGERRPAFKPASGAIMSVSLRRISLLRVADVLIHAASPPRVLVAMVALAAGAFACRDTTTPKEFSKTAPTGAVETMGVGFTSTLIARGTLGTFHMQSKFNGYDVELKSHDNTDVAVSNIGIAAGGSSGWHSHPGPVLVVVKSGTITHYRSDDPGCAAHIYGPGTSFTEQGGLVHNATNQGAEAVVAVATFLAPPGAALRIDEAKPDNCS
jgi:quercetin dioxygenase-like cupin family protein